MATPLKTWLRLFRAPNLLTVPGDPLAGFLLAGGVLSFRALFPIAASLCFYAAGLLMNDLLDYNEDLCDRPNRPLPSGAILKQTVLITAAALAATAVILCALAGAGALRAGLLLAASIAAYNAITKNIPILGALNMGACRGFSVLLGAAAASGTVFTAAALIPAAVVALYIAAVTNLARNEMTPARHPAAAWLPGLSLVAGGAILLTVPRFHSPLFLAPFSAATVAAAWIALRLRRDPVPPAIGAMIRLLLFLQAAFCFESNAACAVALLLLWPLSRTLGRSFAGS